MKNYLVILFLSGTFLLACQSKQTAFNPKFTLSAAEKIKFCSSDEFWTVCFGLNRPLDPANGFVISDSKKNPWLEEEYVSGLAELEKTNSDSWRINVIDRERYLCQLRRRQTSA